MRKTSCSKFFLVAFEQEAALLALPEDARLAWLRRVAQHKLIDAYRRLNRRPAVPLDALKDMLEEDADLGPEQVALRREEERRVAAAVRRLPALCNKKSVRFTFCRWLALCADCRRVRQTRRGRANGLVAGAEISCERSTKTAREERWLYYGTE